MQITLVAMNYASNIMTTSNPIKILIIEDNTVEAVKLRVQLEECGYTVVGHSSSVRNAMVKFDKHKPDLVIIEPSIKGEATGIDLLQQLLNKNTICIILTQLQSDESYAQVRGYGNIIYLVKPVFRLTLFSVIESELEKKAQSSKHFILVRGFNKMLVPLLFSDIDWIHSEGNYILIHTNERDYIMKRSILSMIEILDNHFSRIHKRYVVNKRSVMSFNSTEVILKEMVLPLGRLYKKGFYQGMGSTKMAEIS